MAYGLGAPNPTAIDPNPSNLTATFNRPDEVLGAEQAETKQAQTRSNVEAHLGAFHRAQVQKTTIDVPPAQFDTEVKHYQQADDE